MLKFGGQDEYNDEHHVARCFAMHDDDNPFPPELKDQLRAHCMKEIEEKIEAMELPTSKLNK